VSLISEEGVHSNERERGREGEDTSPQLVWLVGLQTTLHWIGKSHKVGEPVRLAGPLTQCTGSMGKYPWASVLGDMHIGPFGPELTCIGCDMVTARSTDVMIYPREGMTNAPARTNTSIISHLLFNLIKHFTV